MDKSQDKKESSDILIDVHHLKKVIANRVVIEDVSLQIKRGEIFGFLGPNGAGKTTTLRMLCGLLTPDAGSGQCLGFDIIKERAQIKYHVGYVAQYFGLYPNLTVYENLMLIAKLYGLINRDEKILAVMEQLGLTQYKDRRAGQLSGGWQQKLSLATALIHEPFILLLDEPTASIDPRSRKEFWDLMHTLADGGTTIMLSSHNMDEIEHCHRISFLDKGKIMFYGSFQDITDQTRLLTWTVTGKNLPLLAKQLKLMSGIEQVITLYDELHVSGRDNVSLEQAKATYRDYQWKQIDPTPQDIFVWLSSQP